MLFCIIGKSSTGKDTIFKELLKKKEYGLKNVVSYTTRPIRAGEKDGIEYHFVTKEEKQALLDAGKVVEIRTYSTCHGPWDYFTVDDESIDMRSNKYLTIATVESYVKMRDFYGSDVVVPIYIDVEDGIRLSRALNRERRQSNPKYNEMCRRFLADAEDFSDEKLAEAGITNIFYNEEIDETVSQIGDFINGYKS